MPIRKVEVEQSDAEAKVAPKVEQPVVEAPSEVVSPVAFKILPVDTHVLKAEDHPPAPTTVRVKIVKRFILNRDNYSTQVFDPKLSNCGEPGCYDVSPEDAANSYLLAHTDHPPPVEMEPGKLAFAEEQKRVARRQTMHDLLTKQMQNEAMAEVKREQLADLRERMGGEQSGLEDPRV